MCFLKCENVSFAYDGKTVVSEINFSVNEGDYLSVVGENGSGKSTLLKGILGLSKPSEGKIILKKGVSRSSIGYLPQQTSFQKDFPASVYEVIISGCLNTLGYLPFYTKKQKETVALNMEKLKITDIRKKCYHDLSGGQQQRVLLARALCAAHSMLLMDEPVSGLDPEAAEEMYSIIKQLNQREKITVIMVTHDIKKAVSDSDYILHLHNKPLFFGKSENYSYEKIRNERL